MEALGRDRREPRYRVPDALRFRRQISLVPRPRRANAGSRRGDRPLVGTATDIERHKQLEQAFERGEALLRHSQRSAHVGSYLVEIPVLADRSQDRSQWSDELYRIFGYRPGAIEPGTEAVVRRIHPDDRERIAAAVNEAYRIQKPFELEYRILRDDGVRTLCIWGEFETGNPLRVWGTCQDVTEQRHATTELREADRRKNEFLAILAHELRNPLAPIRQSV